MNKEFIKECTIKAARDIGQAFNIAKAHGFRFVAIEKYNVRTGLTDMPPYATWCEITYMCYWDITIDDQITAPKRLNYSPLRTMQHNDIVEKELNRVGNDILDQFDEMGYLTSISRCGNGFMVSLLKDSL